MRLRVPHPYQKIKKRRKQRRNHRRILFVGWRHGKVCYAYCCCSRFWPFVRIKFGSAATRIHLKCPSELGKWKLVLPWNYVQTQLQIYASTLFGGKCKLIFRRLFAAVPIKYERSAFRSRLFCLGLHFWFMQISLVPPWLQLQFQTTNS